MADPALKHGGQADAYYADGSGQGYTNGYGAQDQGQFNPPQGPPPTSQQPYTNAPPTYGQDFGGADGKLSFNQTFKIEKPRYNDVWAGILLIITFCGFIAISVISLNGYDSHSGFNGGGIYNNPNQFGLNTNTVVCFGFVCAMALILSWAYISLARIFTKQFIWITGILNIIFAFATAIYMLSRKYWSGGIVFLIFAVLTIFFFISWIPRIPFSVVMLQTAIDVAKKFGHVHTVSAIGGILATGFGAWYSITLVAVYAKYEPGNAQDGTNPACNEGNGGCSHAKVIGLLVAITFAGYWISEWLKNTIHTVIAGVYGSWYFSANNYPTGVTRGSLRRAMTYSFGSISFGSLIVALINMLRQACSIAQQNARGDGNIVGTILFCVLGCFISVLQWLVQFFNRYAFCHIAMYGKAYIPAAKDTWKFMTRRGMDAMVNNCLVGPVLTMGATFVAYACAFMAYLYLVFTSPAYNDDGSFTPVVVAFAFLVGLQIANIFTTPLSSGIDTILVAMAWNPEVLMREHPEVYQKMLQVYPQVQEALQE